MTQQADVNELPNLPLTVKATKTNGVVTKFKLKLGTEKLPEKDSGDGKTPVKDLGPLTSDSQFYVQIPDTDGWYAVAWGADQVTMTKRKGVDGSGLKNYKFWDRYADSDGKLVGSQKLVTVTKSNAKGGANQDWDLWFTVLFINEKTGETLGVDPVFTIRVPPRD